MKTYLKFFLTVFSIAFCTTQNKHNSSILYLEDTFQQTRGCELIASDSIYIDYSNKDILLSSYSLFNISEKNNTLYSVDRYSGRVISINEYGDVNFIGEKGNGPSEYTDVSGLIISENYLYIHDATNSRVIKYDTEINEFQTIGIKNRYKNITPFGIGKFIGYSHTNEHLIHILDSQFEVVDTLHWNNLGGRMNIFLARFQDGNAIKWGDNSVIYMYPDTYGFNIVDMNTGHLTPYTIREDTEYSFIINPIPSGLDPYDYKIEHRDFFESIPRPSIIGLYQENIVLQFMYKISGPREWDFYVNSYSFESNLMCEGIEFDFPQLPFAVGQYVYTVRGVDSLNSVTIYKNTLLMP